jgi:hypothetical protein
MFGISVVDLTAFTTTTQNYSPLPLKSTKVFLSPDSIGLFLACVLQENNLDKVEGNVPRMLSSFCLWGMIHIQKHYKVYWQDLKQTNCFPGCDMSFCPQTRASPFSQSLDVGER